MRIRSDGRRPLRLAPWPKLSRPPAPAPAWTRAQWAAIALRYRLSAGAAQVLWTLTELELAERAAGRLTGGVQPTLAQLVQRSGCSPKVVRRARERLAAAGLLALTPVPPELTGRHDRGPLVTLDWTRLLAGADAALAPGRGPGGRA